MWPLATVGFSTAVNLGNVLNSKILYPPPAVRRSSNSIIDCMRAALVVMTGTKKIGKAEMGAVKAFAQ